MVIIRGNYPDYSTFKNEAYFKLECDKEMNLYTWKPPIYWRGIIDGKNVSFTQISTSSDSRNDFDFGSFPKEVENSIPYIIKAINQEMRVMD